MTKLKLFFYFLFTVAPLTLSAQSEWVVYVDSTNSLIAMHSIQSGETLFSISRQYNTSVEDLRKANSKLDINSLGVGAQLIIPLSGDRTGLTQPEGDFARLALDVIPGQTLFSISRAAHFSVDEVMELNSMDGNNLSPGQRLKLGYYSLSPLQKEAFHAVPDYAPAVELPLETTQTTLENTEKPSPHSPGFTEELELIQTEDRGVAIWNKEWKSTSGFYVLHRSAPVNSIVEIENPMFNRRAFGKVSGRIPESLYSPDVILIVSDGLARHLGVIDQRFFVKVRYLHSK